jgi:Apea-like HEPN
MKLTIGSFRKAIDVSIALEALLGDDRFDLTYKLGLRAARLLSKSFDERKAIRKAIKEFYSIRSAVVHGSKAAQLGADEIQHINNAISYCGRLIVLFVSRGSLPIWDDVELHDTGAGD